MLTRKGSDDMVNAKQFTYLAIEVKDFGTEVEHRFPTTKADDKFTFPRVMNMWLKKAKRLYRVYANGTCDIIKEEV